MALNLPNIAPANPWSDVVDTKNYLTDKALNQQKQKLENKYIPLDKAIKAQNAMSYSNRMGNIGLFLRGISQMPVAERQAYLSDPANRQNYMTMLEQFKSGINNPNASGNILTPEYMKQFNFDQQDSGSANPFMKMMQYFMGQKGGNAMAQPPQQGQFQAPPQAPMQQGQGMMPQGMPQEFGAVNQASPQEVANIAQFGNQAQAPGAAPQQAQPEMEDENIPVSPSISPQERATLNAQMRANNQNIGPQLKNRADAAIAFDKFLQLHKKEIQTVFKDAFKYSQLYGRGKNWLDKFKTNQPEEYANYIKAKNSLTPLMANGIRFLEAMGVSHDSQEDSKRQVASALDALDISPETALKVFNSHMNALADVSEGVMQSAEPAYPGVRRKLAGVPYHKGDFIKPSPKGTKPVAPKGRILVRSSDGKMGSIPESQWEEAKKAGYKRL